MPLAQDELKELDLIESRIVELEKRVFGNLQSMREYIPITDSLLSANALINASLVGRDSIATFMQRLAELDKLLDPTVEDRMMNSSAKMEEVLVMEPLLHENVRALQQIQSLAPVLDSEALKNVPTLTGRLERLTLFYLDKQQETEAITANVMELLQQYNTIIMKITKAFIEMEETVTKWELDAQPKKELE